MMGWGTATRFPTSRQILDELDRQELRRPPAPELPQAAQEPGRAAVVTREALADAWRAVGATDEVVAFGTVGRYWWRRALVGHARHAAPSDL